MREKRAPEPALGFVSDGIDDCDTFQPISAVDEV
jgi:hypothetical protein